MSRVWFPFNINFLLLVFSLASTSSSSPLHCTSARSAKHLDSSPQLLSHTMPDTDTMCFARCTLCSLQFASVAVHFFFFCVHVTTFYFFFLLQSGSREFCSKVERNERRREREFLISSQSCVVKMLQACRRTTSLDEGIRVCFCCCACFFLMSQFIQSWSELTIR